jgi:YebC/PmpR family DNA-binding regulatory protein
MSGHSKWSTIKRQKGANDAKRGLAFTKLSSAITMAVREGGGITDPNGNFRLRLAIDAARAENMPKDTIERAITRGEGKNATEMFDVVYEGFGPGGFSVIVEAITDNKQRTTPEIKTIFDKSGGTLGVPGSVNYQFTQKGQITIAKNDKTLDEVFLIAADFGAEDIEEEEDDIIIYTLPEELGNMRTNLEQKGLIIKSAELLHKPIVMKEITDSNEAEKAINFMEKLEDHGDVQKVYANFAIS